MFESAERLLSSTEACEWHPVIETWFRERFPLGPTDPQRLGWEAIASGKSTLIAAPTGSGKTLSGFLYSINTLYFQHDHGLYESGTRVVYVSPLRALAVDIGENLERPLRELEEVAARMGRSFPVLTCGVRTGDTPQHERSKMVSNPPTFMITTPESLYLLVSSARPRANLKSVSTVIVDEIHALARDKRGAHLSLTLERLERVTEQPPQRIGLSATQRPIATVARMLVGARSTPAGEPDCHIVDVGHQRALDIRIELPAGEPEAVISHEQMGTVLDHLASEVAQHRTTLVFVNNRRLAERLAHQLGERLGEDAVAAHHGSLSRVRRLRVERRLRAGELRALVATASLELGIDIGPVELVCQIASPRSIATFLQRVGRSNHTRSGTPKGVLYPLTRDELVECTALLAALRAGELDQVHPPVAPLDILMQQLVAEVAAEETSIEELFAMVRNASHYMELERSSFEQVLDLAGDGVVTGRGIRGAYLHVDRINGEVRARPSARLAAITSGGAIPEMGDYRVVLEPDETVIGTVNEDWATESMAGDVFLLGTHAWQIRRVGSGEVRVVDAGDRHPTVPFWLGEAPARTKELSEAVSQLRAGVEVRLPLPVPGQGIDTGEAQAWVREEAGVSDDIARVVVMYLAAARASLGVLPTQQRLIFERFFDDTGGMQLVIHSPYGGRINRALGYALRKKFCRTFNFELQASANDDAVVISLGPHHSFPLSDVPTMLRSTNIRDTLEQAVLDQPLFQSRWRWNLNRSLLVVRTRGGKRNPPPIQRMEADDFMAALFPSAAACQENVTGPIEIPDHPMVRQTVHDALTEMLDAEGLIALWREVEAGTVATVFCDVTEPSLLASEILSARPYAFLDGGEAVDRRTNAVQKRPGIPTDLTSIGTLSQEAIDEVREEIAIAPRSPDELHDVLRALVVMQPDDRFGLLFAALVDRGRAQTITVNETERWIASESFGDVQVMYEREPAPPEGRDRDDVLMHAIAGHLEYDSPQTVAQLGGRLGCAEAAIKVGLARLEGSGAALQGQYSESARATGSTEWASRLVLSKMHRRSRSQRRSRVTTVTPEDQLRFLARWQHVAPGTQLRGERGLLTVIEQMQGFEVGAASWERDVLSARIAEYSPRTLDVLCHSGEVAWLRLSQKALRDPQQRGAGPSALTPISIVQRGDLPWLLQAHAIDQSASRPATGPLADVLVALESQGAQFTADLEIATGRMPGEVTESIWEGVSRGLIMGDGFDAIRLRVARSGSSSKSSSRRISRLRGGRSGSGVPGRWSLVPFEMTSFDRDELVEAVADQLLARWGVVFYDVAALEGFAVQWRELQWAFRRLEDRGLVRGGRFIRGFVGEQFASEAAIDQLASARKASGSQTTISVAATDPLNVSGSLLAGGRVPTRSNERVELPA